MKKLFYYLVFPAITLSACGTDPAPAKETVVKEDVPGKIKEENVSYKSDTTTLNSFIAYDESSTAKRPAVIIVPEWWGLTEYAKNRAKQLAALGYIAIAVDFYGNGQIATNPDEALKLATPFYKDPSLAKSRIESTITKLKEYSQTDTGRIAAIGYCFGGTMVLTDAKLGENLKGVVSFHGDLTGIPAKKDLLKARILVCQGEADSLATPAQAIQFRKSMDSIGAVYTFRSYPNAMHAFTNPEADEYAKKFKLPVGYNAAADTASWNDMKTFFGVIFGN